MTGDTTHTDPKFRSCRSRPAVDLPRRGEPAAHRERGPCCSTSASPYSFMQKRIVAHTIVNGRRRGTINNVFGLAQLRGLGLVQEAYTGSYAQPLQLSRPQPEADKGDGGRKIPYPPIVFDNHDKHEGYLTLANPPTRSSTSRAPASHARVQGRELPPPVELQPRQALNESYNYGRNVGNVKIEIASRRRTTPRWSSLEV